jgi:hypothetical protein
MHESGSVFCTTDAHKASDQVFREGTTYLLYGHEVRGKMLKMIITHAIPPYKNFMPTIVLCKYVLTIALVLIVCYLNRCVAKVNR